MCPRLLISISFIFIAASADASADEPYMKIRVGGNSDGTFVMDIIISKEDLKSASITGDDLTADINRMLKEVLGHFAASVTEALLTGDASDRTKEFERIKPSAEIAPLMKKGIFFEYRTIDQDGKQTVSRRVLRSAKDLVSRQHRVQVEELD